MAGRGSWSSNRRRPLEKVPGIQKQITRAARRGSLDEPTARALAIGAGVRDRLDCFDSPQAAAVRDIMTRSLQCTLAAAAVSHPWLYGRSYLRDLEGRSAYGYACLPEQRRRLTRANGSLTGLLERWISEGALPTAAQTPRPTPALARTAHDAA